MTRGLEAHTTAWDDARAGSPRHGKMRPHQAGGIFLSGGFSLSEACKSEYQMSDTKNRIKEHPQPNCRIVHLPEEPYAGKLHEGICEGVLSLCCFPP